jgi:hypothetical protein
MNGQSHRRTVRPVLVKHFVVMREPVFFLVQPKAAARALKPGASIIARRVRYQRLMLGSHHGQNHGQKCFHALNISISLKIIVFA